MTFVGGSLILPESNVDYNVKRGEYRNPNPLDKIFGGISLMPTNDLAFTKWHMANIHCVCADLSADDSERELPFGFADLK